MNDNEIVMTKFLAILFAVCSGLAIGNLYWAQPLLVQIMDGFGLPAANGGLLVTATQIGYAMGRPKPSIIWTSNGWAQYRLPIARPEHIANSIARNLVMTISLSFILSHQLKFSNQIFKK